MSRNGSHHPLGAPATVLMLLTNAYDPDPRVRQEALTLLRLGCRVKLLAWDRDAKSPAREALEGVEVERVFLASRHGRGTAQLFFYALVYLKLLWRGWKTAFDVVHCHDLDTLPVGFLLGKLKRKPVVYDSHEHFTGMLQGSVSPAVLRLLTGLENFLIRRIDLLITVGLRLRAHFQERGAPHAVVVGNWKRLEEFSRSAAQNQELRRKLGVPQTALLVACITNLSKDRKIEALLEAAERCPQVYVLFGGKGALEPLIRERIARNSRILFAGFVPAREIPAYTCAADVIYYGFDPENPNAQFSAPNKLFEALAAGRPLITGDFGEIGEVVRRGACGVVLPAYTPGAVQEALEAFQDREFWTRCAQNAERLGREEMNWARGEEALHREYAALLPVPLHGVPGAPAAGSQRINASPDPVQPEEVLREAGAGR